MPASGSRLLASAESLIKVRPIGAVEGETVPAKVARMEVAVKAGDFAKAIAEYETLPETVEGGRTGLRRQDPGAARGGSSLSPRRSPAR